MTAAPARPEAIPRPPPDVCPLPPAVAERCLALWAAGAEVSTWEAFGRPFAAVWGLPDAERARLLSEPGWGSYSEGCVVWGWERGASAEGAVAT